MLYCINLMVLDWIFNNILRTAYFVLERLMRNICWILFFLALCLSLYANLVENKPYEHIQPNGDKLSLFVSGDEYYHRMHDKDGYTILINPKTGYAVYALPDGNTVKASDYVVGEVNPSGLGIPPNLFANTDEAMESAREMQANRDAGSRAASTGIVNNIVVFARFADQDEFPITKTWNDYNQLFNSLTSPSLKGFFVEASANQLTINTLQYPAAGVNGEVVSLQVTHNRNYYLPQNDTFNVDGYTPENRRARHQALITEILALLGNSVPNNINLDSDNNGIVDAITFIYRGDADANSHLLWFSHYAYEEEVTTLNGIRVSEWVNDFEIGLGLDVMCHEMGHMIGAPDMYHYPGVNMGGHLPWSTIRPTGAWCLMGSDRAQHMLAYVKWKYYHWFPTIPEIVPTSTPTEYTVSSISQSPFSSYKIASSDTSQYYMVEYRRQAGDYEVGVPGSGLIIYRIMSSYGGQSVKGNGFGPPDEVYVYRPGGDIDSNGDPDNAFFSAQSSRTEISNYTNPKPWLYADTLSTPDGSLIIYDVSASGGDSISFTVSTALRNTWTGALNQDWNNINNWTLGVPISVQDVVIPGGIDNFPIIETEAHCNNIVVKENGNLWISSDMLHVSGDFRCYGQLRMPDNLQNGLRVDGNLDWGAGSGTSDLDTYTINLYGSMTFEEGSNVSMHNGVVNFMGSEDSFIHVYEAGDLPRLVNQKTYPAKLEYSSASTDNLTIKDGFYNNSGCLFVMNSSMILHIKNNFQNNPGGHFQFENGTVILYGSFNHMSILDPETDNYFNNLTFSAGPTAFIDLPSTLNINGDFTLISGQFNPANNNIYSKGNWKDFSYIWSEDENTTYGTSTVVFNGTGNQEFNGMPHFYKLELNKPSGEFVFPDSTQVECDLYDWVAGTYMVDGGSFIVNDLVDDGIFGSIILDSGNIEYHQDTAQYVDLRANLTIHAGNFSIYGGSDTALLSYIDTASLTMYGGILDFKDVGIKLLDVYDFNYDIANGRIRTAGDFICERTDFNPSGGTIELYGTADADLKCFNGSNIYNLEINKGARSAENQLLQRLASRAGTVKPAGDILRSNSVNASDTLDIDGYFILTGGTFTAPALIRIAGDWINSAGPAAFVEGTGTVEFNGNGDQYNSFSEHYHNLLIDKHAGKMVINDSTTVVTCDSYTWADGGIEVTAGSFTANDLSQNGIYGKFYCYPDGTIDLHQDTSSWIDLNSFIYNYGGRINIYGGSLPCNVAYSANAGITMTSGILDFKDQGINFTSTTHTLTMNVSGGTFRVNGGWFDSIGDIAITGGTVEFYGSGNSRINQGTGSNFNNLVISKTATRTDGVYAYSNLDIHGVLFISSGVFDVNGTDILVNDDVWVNATLKMMSNGSITVDGDFSWFPAAFSQINNGTITCSGNWTFNNGSAAQLTGCTTILNNAAGIDITYASPNSWFGNLTLDGNGVGIGSIFEFNLANSDSLFIMGNLTVNGNNHLNLNVIPMKVNNVLIQDTGSINTGSFGYLKITSDLDLHGKLNMISGTVIVDGTYTSYSTSILHADYGLLKVYNSASRTERTLVNLGGAIHLNSGTIYVLNNGIYIATHADRIWTNSIIMVDGNFTASEANAFLQDSGEVRCIGALNSLIDVSNGNYVCKLSVYKDSLSTAGLANNITNKGNVYLYSGILAANTFNMTVSGNWSNVSGANKFVPGTGTVIFDKIGSTQTINGANNFYNVTESHTGTILDIIGNVSVSNILNVNNGINFQAAATIGTMNNTVASTDVVFNNSFTSTITSYNGGGKLRVFTLADVIVTDISNNGLYGTYYVDNGVLELHQDIDQSIDVNGPLTILNNGRIDIYGGFSFRDSYFARYGDVILTMDSGELNFKNRGIHLGSEIYDFICNVTGGIIRLNGGFFDVTECFRPTGGRVEFTGSTDCTIDMAPTDYFNDLYICKSASRDDVIEEPLKNSDGTPLTRSNTATLLWHVNVRGNLCITAGVLAASTYTIYVYKNWINQVGSSAFNEGTGTVRFSGSADDSGISTSETFYKLTLYNTSLNWDNVEISNNVTVNVTNNLSISNGTLNMKNNTALIVGNDVTISSGAGLNAFYGTNVNISVGKNWTDGNTSFNDEIGYKYGSSTLSFIGATTSVISVGTTSLDLFNFTINKSAGVQTQFSKPVKVNGNFNLMSGVWYDSVTSLTHEVSGNFNIASGGVWHTSNRNTIALKGSADQTLSNAGASSIYSLTVDKPGSRDTRANSVSLTSNLSNANAGAVLVNAGILDLNHYYFRTSGDITVNSTGKIIVDADGSLELTDAKTLNVNTGGIIELIGYNLHPAKLTHLAGYYGVNINSGATISAKYALFEYMNTSGVYVKSGAIVTDSLAFKNCTFQNGASGGTLLWIDNAQTLTILNPIFPSNSWSGTNNIKKTLNQGTLNIYDDLGSFSGSAYESDAYNRINWIGLTPVGSPVISYISSTNSIRLDWTYPFTVTRFRIYSSTNPDGPFTNLAGTSTTTNYSEPANETKNFYVIIAEVTAR